MVIEHNLDLVRCCDWILDLGPEGGEGGGRVVAEGPPEQVEGCRESHTGAALAALSGRDGAALAALSGPRRCVATLRAGTRRRAPSASSIRDAANGRAAGVVEVVRAREHNLKNVDIELPRNRFTVITGRERQRQEHGGLRHPVRRRAAPLSRIAQRLCAPVRATGRAGGCGRGLRHSTDGWRFEQRTSRGGRKSTVATLTEISHFLRLLFVRLGVQHCPDCRAPIDAQSPDAILGQLLSRFRNRRVELLAPAGWWAARDTIRSWPSGPQARGSMPCAWTANGCPRQPGHGSTDSANTTLSYPSARSPLFRSRADADSTSDAGRLDFGGGRVAVLGDEARDVPVLYSARRACPRCQTSFPELDPRMFSFNSRHGWCGRCRGAGVELEDARGTNRGRVR